MILTENKFNERSIGYEITETGYNIYLDKKIWITQHEPYIPYPDLGYEGSCLKQIEDLARSNENQKEMTLEDKKKQLIEQSKKNLAEYLEAHPITSTCHGEAAEYEITSEKQIYIANMIMTAQLAQTSGIDYQISWNAKGQPCTYDWTLEQITQLAMEMEATVRPLISKQQSIEAVIINCTKEEELDKIDISFEN